MEFYKNKAEQYKRIKKQLKELKPKIECNISTTKFTKNPIVNDIIEQCQILITTENEDDLRLAKWILSKYAEYFELPPDCQRKKCAIGNFVKIFLTKEEEKLKNELNLKNKKETKKKQTEQTLTEQEIENLLDELI